MNRTLGAIAEATFKEWFIDYGPVRAKAAGSERFPGMSQDVFAQLPGHFADSELGPIPAEWKCAPFSELVDLLGGGTPRRATSSYWNGSIPWFSVRDAPTTATSGSSIPRSASQRPALRTVLQRLPLGTTIISPRYGRPASDDRSTHGREPVLLRCSRAGWSRRLFCLLLVVRRGC